MSEGDEGRLLPYDEAAERGALGSIMLFRPELMALALGTLHFTAEAFRVPAHGRIWDAMVELNRDGKAIDLLTVSSRLGKQGLEEIGGSAFLDRLIDATPTAANGEWYLEVVARKWLARRVILEGQRVESEARGKEDAAGVAAEASERLARLVCQEGDERSNEEVVAESVGRWRDARAWREGDESKRPAIGVVTPWSHLTEAICGLSGMVVLAGRPSAGKTTGEDQIACHAARQGLVVARATLDSTRRNLLERAMCREAGCSMPKLKYGWGRKAQMDEAEVKGRELARLGMYFNDRARDISQILAWARGVKARAKRLDLLTVDYVQLIQAAELGFHSQNTVARVAHVSGALKTFGRELGIPVLVLSQLSRGVEKEGRDPMLSDLRDSGSIEQDADAVIFLFVDKGKRKEMEEREPGATKHKRPVVWSIMKQKDGEVGQYPMWLYAPYFRFAIALEKRKGPKGEDILGFGDDGLPADAGETDGYMRLMPEFVPQDEQEG